MTTEDHEAEQLARLTSLADRSKVVAVYDVNGKQLASYGVVPDAPYIQIFADNTCQGEPIFVANTKEDLDRMVDAVRQLAKHRAWLQREFDQMDFELTDYGQGRKHSYQLALEQISGEGDTNG